MADLTRQGLEMLADYAEHRRDVHDGAGCTLSPDTLDRLIAMARECLTLRKRSAAWHACARRLCKRQARSTDWYQQRFNRLHRWVKEEVEPLSSEVGRRFFAICANGSPAPHESADWTGTMHALKSRLECERTRRLSAEHVLRLIARDETPSEDCELALAEHRRRWPEET